jgi:hypothetical protein
MSAFISIEDADVTLTLNGTPFQDKELLGWRLHGHSSATADDEQDLLRKGQQKFIVIQIFRENRRLKEKSGHGSRVRASSQMDQFSES